MAKQLTLDNIVILPMESRSKLMGYAVWTKDDKGFPDNMIYTGSFSDVDAFIRGMYAVTHS